MISGATVDYLICAPSLIGRKWVYFQTPLQLANPIQLQLVGVEVDFDFPRKKKKKEEGTHT